MKNSNIYNLNKIIDEIENNICGNISIAELARDSGLSVYEFRRMFSFAIGVPIGEYIRNRRMTLAARDLLAGRLSVTEVALRYGYDSPSSFTRAFKNFHGFPPNEAAKNKKSVNMLTKVSFNVCLDGGRTVNYHLAEDGEFKVCGFTAVSDISDTECCENVWQGFEESDYREKISDSEKIYAVYQNGRDGVICTIGSRAETGDGDSVVVPPSKWLCFRAIGADDMKTDAVYHEILLNCIESGGYKRRKDMPNIEVFPSNMTEDDFEWEIRIPVE